MPQEPDHRLAAETEGTNDRLPRMGTAARCRGQGNAGRSPNCTGRAGGGHGLRFPALGMTGPRRVVSAATLKRQPEAAATAVTHPYMVKQEHPPGACAWEPERSLEDGAEARPRDGAGLSLAPGFPWALWLSQT